MQADCLSWAAMTIRAPATASPTVARAFSIHALFPLLAAAIWGGMYVVNKWSFAELPPVTLGLARMVLGGLACWLLTTTTPAFVVLLAWLLLREIPTARTVGGTVLAFAGVVVVVVHTGLQGLFAGGTLRGSLLLLAAAAWRAGPSSPPASCSPRADSPPQRFFRAKITSL